CARGDQPGYRDVW
nr:immunoglobulin heavy chain junction region [Macaca mulatta]MOW78429.1 immunoglobulin heavy chain junction region [Macaca mulatta]MOW78867.1 immunoglobulin heavy chain junction region [Macaca mulatta]MOW81595.1 immunoglobulin heavy chain junction region [Macaca mulatta]MOW81603.1 immunoglobulin heavy chain junction region [Macaca mulatta]